MINNQNLSKTLNKVNTANIKSIVIRTIGLIDVFGKMIIDITYTDDSEQSLEIPSPVPTDLITKWLDTNALLDKTVMYRF